MAWFCKSSFLGLKKGGKGGVEIIDRDQMF